jgi:hypothetical protein
MSQSLKDSDLHNVNKEMVIWNEKFATKLKKIQ